MEQQTTMKPYVIGLDLGGTNSVFGIVDSRGDIKATTAIKTGNYPTAEAYVDACMEALPVIIDQVGGIEKIKAMGIGAPNGNYYKGTVEFAANLIDDDLLGFDAGIYIIFGSLVTAGLVGCRCLDVTTGIHDAENGVRSS